MAGRGPAPAEQKRRRNKPEGFDELPVCFEGKAPALPKTYRSLVTETKDGEAVQVLKTVPYLKATRDWYAEWCTSPMAARFAATDWTRLRMVVAPLFDRFQRCPTQGLAAELRLQETLLGATAMDRQRLRWTLPEAGAPEGKAAGRRAPAAGANKDRRARLSVVK